MHWRRWVFLAPLTEFMNLKKVYLFSLILFCCIIWNFRGKINYFHIKYSGSAHFPAPWALPPERPFLLTQPSPTYVPVSVHYVPSHESHTLFILCYFIISSSKYLVRSTIIKFLIMRVYPAAYYFFPLSSKYLPQHSVLECPRSTVYPLCDRSHLTLWRLTTYI